MPPFEFALILCSGFLHASWNAAAKGSGTPTGFLLAIDLVSLALFVPILLVGFRPSEVPREVWGLVLVSGFVPAFYAYWLSRAYAHTELSIAYPIVRSTPALVPFIAVPFLGESLSLGGSMGIALVVLSLWAVLFWLLVGVLLAVAFMRVMAVRRAMRAKPLDDDDIRTIVETGVIAREDDTPLDLEEIEEEEKRFWDTEEWDEAEEW